MINEYLNWFVSPESKYHDEMEKNKEEIQAKLSELGKLSLPYVKEKIIEIAANLKKDITIEKEFSSYEVEEGMNRSVRHAYFDLPLCQFLRRNSEEILDYFGKAAIADTIYGLIMSCGNKGLQFVEIPYLLEESLFVIKIDEQFGKKLDTDCTWYGMDSENKTNLIISMKEKFPVHCGNNRFYFGDLTLHFGSMISIDKEKEGKE